MRSEAFSFWYTSLNRGAQAGFWGATAAVGD